MGGGGEGGVSFARGFSDLLQLIYKSGEPY